jgi:hypothetical protein
MRIDGEWYECDDGFIRPVIRGEILASDGTPLATPFLLDTGADRTVIAAPDLAALSLDTAPPQDGLSGVGGPADSVLIETKILLPTESGASAVFRGEYAAFTNVESLEMSVIGRDILNMFAVIVDRPGHVVSLLTQRHRYRIVVS